MNSFNSQATLASGKHTYTIYRLPALTARGFNLGRLPFSLRFCSKTCCGTKTA